ncbi:feruloyl-CoA synthase [Nitrogeniibacter aestuarii]|uniref:feruloyl-CoA synthase n=1 Tax=Nitrogeniibacter aestuarii TaxID=2815343 RepID=UPI001E56FA42|nr:feruloyl-CoA synthase [Nitrogeniibacter aestuarii]
MQLASIDAEGVRYRAVAIGNPRVDISRCADGAWLLQPGEALEAYPTRLTDRLVEGAGKHPDRTLVAQRGPDGEWVRISYAQMLERARAVGQALLQRGLSVERPVMILSGNDLDHLTLALAALHVGIPHCSVSPGASLLSRDFNKLRHMVDLLTPGLVYATEGDLYAPAIAATVPADVEVVTGNGQLGGRTVTAFAQLLDTTPTHVDAAHEAVGPDAIAKFLFTSGSTSMPKAVITTERMLCANQQMLLQTFPCFADTPPVLLDWLPWNHTFGGSHNVGIVLYNGGTLYINDGKPTPAGFVNTLRNLREIAPTVYLDVPKGWEMLGDALEADPALREIFYSKMQLFFFAGAGLSQAAWDKLDRVSEAHCGERIRVMTGLGMTETSPSSMFSTGPLIGAGYVGLPAPGCIARMVPVNGKLEARFAGPHVTPGYWRQPEVTRAAFDDEGYYCTGDALAFADPDRPDLGMIFDGRIAENFKLSSGTFVHVGPLRARIIAAGAPCVQDAVITGINRDEIGALIFPRLEHCAALAGLPDDAPISDVLATPAVRAFFQHLLDRINADATGSASRIEYMLVLDTPPSVDRHEVTDKGSINQRAVLANRAALIEAMYAGEAAGMLTRKPRA